MKLALFFTRSTSLKDWLDRGLFDREKLIYEHHLLDETLDSVIWFTYGKSDFAISEELKRSGRLDSRVIVKGYPRWLPHGRIGCLAYSFLLPLFQYKSLKLVDLLKTNQLDGGWSAVLARFLFGKPLILRCGYVQSKLERSLNRLSSWRMRLMNLTEGFLYKHADIAVVSSHHDARYVVDKYGLPFTKVNILHNYIEETLFSPNTDMQLSDRKERILFVGRFSLQKNLDNLLKAAALARMPLDLVGSGPLQDKLEVLICELGADIRLIGAIPNRELPALINRYRYFALTSLTEGMPKTLLEAMSCGLVCIGTKVNGINEVIQDGINGFLAENTDAESIYTALERARAADAVLVCAAARTRILEEFTISAVAKQERAIFLSLKK